MHAKSRPLSVFDDESVLLPGRIISSEPVLIDVGCWSMLGVLVPETMQMKKTKSNHRRLEARRGERQKMRFAFFAVFAVAASAMVLAVHADDWYAGADLGASGDTDTFRYCGDGAPIIEIHNAGDTISAPAKIPEKEGYTFKHWTGECEHAHEFSTMPNKSMILTPFWAVNQYEVVIDDPGHLTVMDDEVVIENGDEVDYGTLLTVKAKERVGYTSKVLLNGTEVSEGYFKVGLENVLDVEYKADPAVIDDDDDSNYQPYPVTNDSSPSDSEKVDVMAVAAVAGLVAVLGALVAFKF